MIILNKEDKGSLKMLTIKDVSKALNVSEISIRRYIEQGKIKAVKIGNVWRISLEEVNRIIKEGA